MSSKKILKSTGSALVLGSSLASLVGQQSANADLLGSIKKWFFGDKTKNKEKKLSLKERKQKYNNEMYKRGMLEESSPVGVSLATLLIGSFLSLPVAGFAGHLAENNYAAKNIHSFSEYFDKLEDMRAAGNAVTGKALKWGFIITALTAVGLGVYSYIEQKNAEKDFNELRTLIGEEEMLKKQWNLEDFQKMAENAEESKEFIRQLLVLGSNSNADERNDFSLNKKVEAFMDLFKDKEAPDNLKSEKFKNKKEIYKEIINSLYSWCCGKMERLYDDSGEGRYDEKKYFKAQDDIELASRIYLLREIIFGEDLLYYPECLSFLTSQDFYKHLIDKSKPNFKKLLLHDTREYVSQEDASDEDIIEILKELTKSNQIGTIKSRRNKFARDYVNVPVVSADDKNMRRYGEIFNKELKTFLKQREKEKSGDLKGIYEKQLKILQGIKKFSDQKHRFSERFYRIRHSIYLNEPDEDLGIVDNLAFRAEAAYEGILKEYNNLKEAEKNK